MLKNNQNTQFRFCSSTSNKDTPAVTAFINTFESLEKWGWSISDNNISNKNPEVNQKSLSRKSKLCVTKYPTPINRINESPRNINLVLLFIGS